MKALIATKEIFDWIWISSWVFDEDVKIWNPVSSEIKNCQRVAQVEPDDKIFPVHNSLIWVTCPDNCVADEWYYKNEELNPKPQDVPMPATPVEILP
jgi:hypothetical protein